MRQALRPDHFISGLELGRSQGRSGLLFDKRRIRSFRRESKVDFCVIQPRSVVTIPDYGFTDRVAVVSRITIQDITLSASCHRQLCSGEKRIVIAFEVHAIEKVVAFHICNFEPSDRCL